MSPSGTAKRGILCGEFWLILLDCLHLSSCCRGTLTLMDFFSMLNFFMTMGSGSSPDPNIYYRTKKTKSFWAIYLCIFLKFLLKMALQVFSLQSHFLLLMCLKLHIYKCRCAEGRSPYAEIKCSQKAAHDQKIPQYKGSSVQIFAKDMTAVPLVIYVHQEHQYRTQKNNLIVSDFQLQFPYLPPCGRNAMICQ